MYYPILTYTYLTIMRLAKPEKKIIIASLGLCLKSRRVSSAPLFLWPFGSEQALGYPQTLPTYCTFPRNKKTLYL